MRSRIVKGLEDAELASLWILKDGPRLAVPVTSRMRIPPSSTRRSISASHRDRHQTWRRESRVSLSMWTRRTVATALMLLAAACGGDPSAQTPTSPMPTTSPEATSRFPALSEEELLAMSEPVSLRGEGGVHLEGRLFGSGEVGVVLAHMGGSGDQSQWLALAGLLAEHGYRVLTYNRRGSCPGGDLGCSGGRNEGAAGRT